MAEEQSSPLYIKLASIAFFALLSIAAFVWFFWELKNLISGFSTTAPVVGFDKGAMYMLGIGMGLLLLTYGGVIQGLLGKELNAKRSLFFSQGLIVSFVLMFSLPHLAHYTVVNVAEGNNYTLCSNATYRWLLYGKYYFTSSELACIELAAKR